MSAHSYKIVDVVGSAPEGVDAAIRNGLDSVAKSVKHMRWFEVDEIRGHIEDGAAAHTQVHMRVGFRIEE